MIYLFTLHYFNQEFPYDILLGHVYKSINVFIISLHVFVFDEPFQLFLYHLFRWQKHVLEYLDEFTLKQKKI